MELVVKSFVFNPFQENTYVVSNHQNECVIIDPGCYTAEEKQELKAYIETNNLSVLALLNTHCHIDHTLGNAFVVNTFQVDFHMHKLDLPTLQAIPQYAHVYGFPGIELSPEPTKFVEDKEILTFGGIELEVIFGPGHAPGHVAFYNKENSILIGGDIIFQGSFGRVDLPGGDIEILKQTIHQRIFTLPENTIVYSGHGPSTTVGQEKKTNYILQF